MWDGREVDLPKQALSALITHSEITEQPTARDLQRIADFQEDRLFSSRALEEFAGGGTPCHVWMDTRHLSSVGARFRSQPGVVNCSLCHSGPMLNETLPSVPMQVLAGSRFTDTLVSALNRTGLPLPTYVVTTADGSTMTLRTSDPSACWSPGIQWT